MEKSVPSPLRRIEYGKFTNEAYILLIRAADKIKTLKSGYKTQRNLFEVIKIHYLIFLLIKTERLQLKSTNRFLIVRLCWV